MVRMVSRVLTKAVAAGGRRPRRSGGFPAVGRASAVLLEAKARKIGARDVPSGGPPGFRPELSNENNDATRVQVEALLLSDVVRLDQRVLELQAGSHHFLARLRTDGALPTLLRRGSRLPNHRNLCSAP